MQSCALASILAAGVEKFSKIKFSNFQAKSCRKKEDETKSDIEEENRKLKEEIQKLQNEISKKKYEQNILLDQLELISNEVNISKQEKIENCELKKSED